MHMYWLLQIDTAYLIKKYHFSFLVIILYEILYSVCSHVFDNDNAQCGQCTIDICLYLSVELIISKTKSIIRVPESPSSVALLCILSGAHTAHSSQPRSRGSVTDLL